MKKPTLLHVLMAGGLVAAGLAATLPGASAASPGAAASAANTVRVCPAHPKPGWATCLAVAMAGPDGRPLLTAHPLAAGFTPAQIQDAYNLTGLTSGGATVAIIDAAGYPTLASDLSTYRSHYGLPPCTKANGCLTMLNQNGGTRLPRHVNGSWRLEQALDVDMVSAACPDCKILMVQADSGRESDLKVAVETASQQPGVVAISNSYIFSYVKDHRRISEYNHRGIAITAGTGDSGYKGGGYPADDPHVVAVSGTSLFADGSRRGYSERAWGGTGSGCAENPSNYMPAWQQSVGTTCTDTKAVGDVSAAADPGNGGLEIFVNGGWGQVGGTSEATPLIAAVYALSGNTKGYPARFTYGHTGHLYDITEGSNGSCGAPLCTAGPGWDGVTGLGTPNGVASF